MNIESSGPLLTEQRLRHFEEERRVRLASSYREFLLRYNGGTPTPDTIDIPGAPGTPTDVQVLFGLERNEATSTLDWNTDLLNERGLGRVYLPFACDSGGNLFCFKLEGYATGPVVYLDLDSSELGVYPVCGTFDEFVMGLKDLDISRKTDMRH